MEYRLYTPGETAKALAERHKKLRLLNKLTRRTLAERSGVTVASLIRFEQQAQISLENLLKLFSALGRLDEIENLLHPPAAKSIDDLEKQEIPTPKRGTI